MAVGWVVGVTVGWVVDVAVGWVVGVTDGGIAVVDTGVGVKPAYAGVTCQAMATTTNIIQIPITLVAIRLGDTDNLLLGPVHPSSVEKVEFCQAG